MFKVGDRVNVRKENAMVGPALPGHFCHGPGVIERVDAEDQECPYLVLLDTDVSHYWVFEQFVEAETATSSEAVTSTHASLERVFALAVEQSQSGKGADRHGNGQSFDDQPIFTLNRPLGTNHGALFQVLKKTTESAKLASTGRVDMAKNELLGAMVYAAAAYLMLEETEGKNA